jgi:hypothetical protein
MEKEVEHRMKTYIGGTKLIQDKDITHIKCVDCGRIFRCRNALEKCNKGTCVCGRCLGGQMSPAVCDLEFRIEQ